MSAAFYYQGLTRREAIGLLTSRIRNWRTLSGILSASLLAELIIENWEKYRKREGIKKEHLAILTRKS